MTGAMYAAIAGLRTHMQNLNVIGNNIANVNTYGYKASRAVFKTSLYTTLSGGSNGTAVMGGTNPSQIGYGSTVASVDIDMSTGNYAVTGSNTDMMLDGDGFFLVGSKEIAMNFDGTNDDVNRLTSFTLTRVGDFQFRADGYLAKNDGNCAYGFLCIGYVTKADITPDENGAIDPKFAGMKEGDPIFSDQLVPIRYPRVEKVYVDKDGNEIDPDDPNVNPDDIAGQSIIIRYPTEGLVTTGENGTTTVDGTRLYDYGYDPVLEDSPLEMASFTGISIDPNTGVITANSDDTGEVVVIGCIAVGRVTNPNGVTNIGDNYYKAGQGSGQLRITVLNGNAAKMGISQVNHSLWRAPAADDPNAPADDGEYPGLNIYSSASHIVSNGLEMSKTDLAQEIAQMILTQRGYQANTRIVTVTDSMLEELVNMKR